MAGPVLNVNPSDRLFVLTGAGISQESGVPTFRDGGGLWRNYRIEEVASPGAWQRDPRLVWEFYSMRRQVAAQAKPNRAHAALAAWERAIGERFFLCTQNVDDLHERAGSRRLVHMHGELCKSRCDTCSRPPFPDTQLYPEQVPRCQCGGRIRPHICWFGETPFEMDAIFFQLENCTQFLAIGTSGLVEPAASFVARARGHATTIYVGPEEPGNRSAFAECYLGRAGEVLPKMFALPDQVA